MHPDISFRPARADDVAAAVPLIYSSGPAAFDYVFDAPGRSSAVRFLERAFVDGAGEFGFRNHVVGLLDGAVVAAGAAWDGRSNVNFALAAARQILGHYGLSRGGGVIGRGLRVESVVQPPARACWYVAHLGVLPTLRSRGVGRALLKHLLEQGRDRGHATAALDVAVTNDRAQALYERYGFIAARECRSALGNERVTVPDHRRMTLRIGAVV